MRKEYRNIIHRQLFASIIALILCSCGHPEVPSDATAVGSKPVVYPDYTDVTLPANLCAPNFMLRDCEEAVARFSVNGISYTYGDDNKVIIDEDEWEELCDAASSSGKPINVEVFACVSGKWSAYKPFNITVARDSIDPYISYRLILPSYVAYEDLSIDQRNLTSYEETNIYNNVLVSTEQDGQCINCHSYQNYKTDNMLFHMRQSFGGTMLVTKGELRKIDLKTDSTLSAGVYPAWHPALNMIAFSTNKTQQVFHTKDHSKIEVFDTASDLILYDVDKNTVSTICNAEDEFEVFPTWSPDGKTLYYCSAHFEYHDTIDHVQEIVPRLAEIKYSIYSRSFDPTTRKFGDAQLIYDAAALGKSATLPRISPDGKTMVFAIGNMGCFHVWHPEADIMALDLATGTVRPLDGLNSKCSESYPSFSSNGRWILTASRRDDNNFTRPYISYYDRQGKCHKAFEVPQKDPEFYSLFMRSYNRPEFMTQPVTISPQEFANKAREDAVKASYK